MGNTVGTDGLAAIRDFVKPYVISASDISNSSDIEGTGDFEISPLIFGHSSLHYSGYMAAAKITEALKGNFGQVTEFDNQTVITLHRTGANCYQGTRRASNGYDQYEYIVYVNSDSSCEVWVNSLKTVNTADSNEIIIEFTSLFSFTTEELMYLFSQFMSGASFIFTKSREGSSTSITSSSTFDRFYMQVPLDTQASHNGVVFFNYNGPSMDQNLNNVSVDWVADSYYFNGHQKGIISAQTINGTNYLNLTLMNTQDKAIQVLSASDYAGLSTKDNNTIYIVPEE